MYSLFWQIYFVDNGPKTVKLFLNQETVDIDYVKTNEPIETIE
jgi:hypothetical protein